MTALERIDEMAKELELQIDNETDPRNYPNFVTRLRMKRENYDFLLKAFKVMREIAKYHGDIEADEHWVDEEFEKRMSEK